MSETFEEWFKNNIGAGVEYVDSREAWNHQQEKIEKAEKVIEAVYNIDTKYIDNPKVTYRDYYNSTMELIEKYFQDKEQKNG